MRIGRLLCVMLRVVDVFAAARVRRAVRRIPRVAGIFPGVMAVVMRLGMVLGVMPFLVPCHGGQSRECEAHSDSGDS